MQRVRNESSSIHLPADNVSLFFSIGGPHTSHQPHLHHLLIDTFTGSINQCCEQGVLRRDVQASLCCVDLEPFRDIHRSGRAWWSCYQISHTQKVECVFSLIVNPMVYINTDRRQGGHQQEGRTSGEAGEDLKG